MPRMSSWFGVQSTSGSFVCLITSRLQCLPVLSSRICLSASACLSACSSEILSVCLCASARIFAQTTKYLPASCQSSGLRQMPRMSSWFGVKALQARSSVASLPACNPLKISTGSLSQEQLSLPAAFFRPVSLSFLPSSTYLRLPVFLPVLRFFCLFACARQRISLPRQSSTSQQVANQVDSDKCLVCHHGSVCKALQARHLSHHFPPATH